MRRAVILLYIVLATAAIAIIWASRVTLRDPACCFDSVSPALVLSNASDRTLIVAWQTSMDGFVPSPQQQQNIEPGRGVRIEPVSQVWVERLDSPQTEPAPLNTIEVWIYDAREPDRQLANYKTTLRLSREHLLDDNGPATIEVAVSKTLGVEVAFER